MSEEEFKIYVKETLDSIYSKIDNNEKEFISNLVQEFNNSCEINKDLKERIEKAVKFIKEKYVEDYSNNYDYILLENLCLENCDYERSLQVLEILEKKEVE